jgi:nitrite reductase/ring-hydroxylating ferredoxin subunit
MKRAEGLVALSRRQFCGGLATCLGLATLSGCIDGDGSAIDTGGLGGSKGSNGQSPDAGTVTPPTDGGVAATCPTTGANDAGMPTTFLMNKPVYFSNGNYFVVRDGGGLYAVSARCTHEGATCTAQTSQFYCPRHGAKFDFNGGVISGPVITGLTHFAMCLLANGHVGVIPTQSVAKTQRLAA